ncbi:MAG: 50S ribosomal protein L10 [Oscillospiraceae bacterium]|nr:50S ribosomal protein L10 [Oscillospiraceae bacterium]
MPNAKVLSEKQAIVAALVERIQNAQSGILVDYKGITVAEDTELRAALRKDGVDYSVVKNTLTRKALDQLDMSALDEHLNGTTSLATCSTDPIAPFRLINEYSKKLNERFNIKAAFMEGKVLSEQEIAELSTLTSKNDLYSKLAGSLNAIMGGLAVCLAEVIEQKGGAPESAPAAE